MTARLEIRVIPRASKNEIAGWRDGRLLVRVTAPPVDSAANEAVIALLAKRLEVPKGSLRLAAGQNSRNKTIAIEGLSPDVLRHRLRF